MSEWTPELLASIVGVLLSLAFSYIPGGNSWWSKLAAEYKRLIMLGLLALVSGSAYVFSCVFVVLSFVTCDTAGVMVLVRVFLLAMIANQSAYAITPRKDALKQLLSA